MPRSLHGLDTRLKADVQSSEVALAISATCEGQPSWRVRHRRLAVLNQEPHDDANDNNYGTADALLATHKPSGPSAGTERRVAPSVRPERRIATG